MADLKVTFKVEPQEMAYGINGFRTIYMFTKQDPTSVKLRKRMSCEAVIRVGVSYRVPKAVSQRFFHF